MAKKKRPISAKIRNQELRQRKVDAGKRQLSVWLDGSLIDRIDQIKCDQSRDDIINAALKAHTQRTPAKKKVATKNSVKGGECSLCFQWRPDAELDHLLRGKNRYKTSQCKDFTACATTRHIIK